MVDLGKKYFTEDDYKKVIEFMNFVGTKFSADGWRAEDTITHFKLLSHLQTVILPLIKDHIFEPDQTKVVEPKKDKK